MPSTPKVKMPLSLTDLASLLELPENVEIIGMFVTNDPLSTTLILISDDAFDELYLPDGGFDPTLSYKTIDKDFFKDQA